MRVLKVGGKVGAQNPIVPKYFLGTLLEDNFWGRGVFEPRGEGLVPFRKRNGQIQDGLFKVTYEGLGWEEEEEGRKILFLDYYSY